MPTLELNIYKAEDLNVVEKTYTAESVELMFGVAEDFMQIVGIDQMQNRQELAARVLKAFNSLKPLLKDVFSGLTDDELRRTKVRELLPLFVEIFDLVLKDMNDLMPKNAMWA